MTNLSTRLFLNDEFNYYLMTISIAFNRPKATATNNVNETIDVGTAIATSDYVELRVFLDGITVDNTVVTADPGISWTGATITGPAGTFSDVRVGDVISSSTGFVSSQVVNAINVDGSQVTASASADVDTNNEELTFTPGTIDSTLYYIRLAHTTSGNTLSVVPTISCFDGTLVEDGSTDDGSDDVTFAQGTQKTLNGVTLNLDTFLTNARVARTN